MGADFLLYMPLSVHALLQQREEAKQRLGNQRVGEAEAVGREKGRGKGGEEERKGSVAQQKAQRGGTHRGGCGAQSTTR